MPQLRLPSRFEIWQVSLNDTQGHEQTGERPAIVLAIHTRANVCMVIPLTGNQDTLRFPFSYGITRSATNGLAQDSVVLIYQMRCLTSSRLIRRIGSVEPHHIRAITTLLKNYLGLGETAHS